MGVHVDETRSDDKTGGIDDGDAGLLDPGLDGADSPVDNQDVQGIVRPGQRVYDPAVFNQKFHAASASSPKRPWPPPAR